MNRPLLDKSLAILALMVVLLIPLSMIKGLIYERQTRRDAVVNELAQTFTGEQTVTGPFLVIPYAEHVHAGRTSWHRGKPAKDRLGTSVCRTRGQRYPRHSTDGWALYLLIRSEDHALLMGTLLLTVVFLVVMVITRKVDWYQISRDLRDPSLGESRASTARD